MRTSGRKCGTQTDGHPTRARAATFNYECGSREASGAAAAPCKATGGPGLHFLIESLSSSPTEVAALTLSSSLSPRHPFVAVGATTVLWAEGRRGRENAGPEHHSVTRYSAPCTFFFLCRRGTCQEVVRAPYPHPHTAAVSSAGRLSSSQFPGHPSSELRLRHRPSSRLPPSTHDGTRGSRRCLTGDRAKLLVGAC